MYARSWNLVDSSTLVREIELRFALRFTYVKSITSFQKVSSTKSFEFLRVNNNQATTVFLLLLLLLLFSFNNFEFICRTRKISHSHFRSRRSSTTVTLSLFALFSSYTLLLSRETKEKQIFRETFFLHVSKGIVES